MYLLEDEQELSLGMLIRLQRIYNLWSIHAVILSFLGVLQSFYSNFISFLGLTYWPSAHCQLLFFACFLHRRKSISNGVQTPRNFLDNFYGPEHPRWAREAPGGAPRGAQPTWARLGARYIWTPFGIDFLWCKKTSKKQQLALGTGSIG